MDEFLECQGETLTSLKVRFYKVQSSFENSFFYESLFYESVFTKGVVQTQYEDDEQSVAFVPRQRGYLPESVRQMQLQSRFERLQAH